MEIDYIGDQTSKMTTLPNYDFPGWGLNDRNNFFLEGFVGVLTLGRAEVLKIGSDLPKSST